MTMEPTPVAETQASPGLRRIIMIAAGALIGVIVLTFIIAVIFALIDVEGAAPVVRMIRDLFVIFLALEGILIVLALAILILQVARLIALLQNEVKPILLNTQETVRTAQTTVRFVGENVTRPAIAINAFLAGAGVVVTNLFGIRRALRSNNNEKR